MIPAVYYSWLGQVPYQHAWTLQKQLASHLEKSQDVFGWLLLLTHPPTFTLGKRQAEHYIHASIDQLSEKGFEVIQTDRGGLVTYHGPGQLVGYPVLNIKRLGLTGITDYVCKLQHVMKAVCSSCGIEAHTKSEFPGLWVGTNKIGAIGLHIRNSISTHGFALNISPNLDHYRWITPCGIEGHGITSLEKEGATINMERATQLCCNAFASEFGVELEKRNPWPPDKEA